MVGGTSGCQWVSVVVGSSGCQWLLAAVGVSGGWQQWVVVYNSRCGHRVLLEKVGLKCILKACFLFF